MSTKLYLLFYSHSHFCCGVYSSKEELRKAVDYHTRSMFLKINLHWEMWCQDNAEGPYEIDWAYVDPRNSIEDVIQVNVWRMLIPAKKYWGKNLVESKYKMFTKKALEKETKGLGLDPGLLEQMTTY